MSGFKFFFKTLLIIWTLIVYAMGDMDTGIYILILMLAVQGDDWMK